jgi:hypothetical protein
MKRIRLLSLPDPRFGVGSAEYEANRVDYRSVIEQAIRVPLDRQAGATIDEMRKGIRVLDALDRVPLSGTVEPGPNGGVELHPNTVLELEDADWEHLKHKVERMPWAVVDRRFVQFHDDITGASETPRDVSLRDAAPAADGVVSATRVS